MYLVIILVCIPLYFYMYKYYLWRTCSDTCTQTMYKDVPVHQCSPQSRETGRCAPLFFQEPCYLVWRSHTLRIEEEGSGMVST